MRWVLLRHNCNAMRLKVNAKWVVGLIGYPKSINCWTYNFKTAEAFLMLSWDIEAESKPPIKSIEYWSRRRFSNLSSCKIPLKTGIKIYITISRVSWCLNLFAHLLRLLTCLSNSKGLHILKSANLWSTWLNCNELNFP